MAFCEALETNDLRTAATLLSETKDSEAKRCMLTQDVLEHAIERNYTDSVRFLLTNCPDELLDKMVGAGQGIKSAIHLAAALWPSDFVNYDNGPLRALLDDRRVATEEMFNQLDDGSHNDGVQTTVLMDAATVNGNDIAMRLLLDHPAADAARMIANRDACGRNTLMLLAERGCVVGMEALLDHPAAEPAALLSDRVFRPEGETHETHRDGEGIWILLKEEPYADGGESAVTMAARFAVHDGDYAPLLFLLRRCIGAWGVGGERSQEQLEHVTAVLGLLSTREDADDADDVMQECVHLLLELGATVARR